MLISDEISNIFWWNAFYFITNNSHKKHSYSFHNQHMHHCCCHPNFIKTLPSPFSSKKVAMVCRNFWIVKRKRQSTPLIAMRAIVIIVTYNNLLTIRATYITYYKIKPLYIIKKRCHDHGNLHGVLLLVFLAA